MKNILTIIVLILASVANGQATRPRIATPEEREKHFAALESKPDAPPAMTDRSIPKEDEEQVKDLTREVLELYRAGRLPAYQKVRRERGLPEINYTEERFDQNVVASGRLLMDLDKIKVVPFIINHQKVEGWAPRGKAAFSDINKVKLPMVGDTKTINSQHSQLCQSDLRTMTTIIRGIIQPI